LEGRGLQGGLSTWIPCWQGVKRSQDRISQGQKYIGRFVAFLQPDGNRVPRWDWEKIAHNATQAMACQKVSWKKLPKFCLIL
jgi:hypothetical protein